MPSFPPTAEQTAIVNAVQTGETTEVRAGAGTGKTSTLVLAAEALGNKAIAYLAFNKDIATEATSKMPANVEARTVNSFAYRGTIVFPKSPQAANFVHGGEPAITFTRFLGINAPLSIPVTGPNGEGERVFKSSTLGYIVSQTVERFCQSADDEVTAYHVPLQDGLDKLGQNRLAAYILPLAIKAWAEISNYKTTGLRMDHCHYTKSFQLAGTKLKVRVNGVKGLRPAEVVLFDEAQDAPPVFRAIVENQTQAQIVVVGDENQAIYGFTGAVNALGNFNAKHTLKLTKSFRFGPAIAEVANKLLAQLDTDMRIVGHDPVPSQVVV